ncbi:unnamed protein product [Orchesella dallaii]|uniref:Uncharacterized protein n=1 Tax=Orchesella dallaii TaxID=48710 RepID=A0ABP1QAV8_9HEXA
MPMPQRNTRRVAQLLSNNSLLSGTGASGISTVTGLSNCINSGSNSTNTAGNGRLYGHPVAAAGLAGAAAASASALNSISASAHHHQPPPLITDTLTACLDVNGTYICTSYSPRCYIIQKVTPNTVTVTPHVIGGEASTSTGIVTGGSPQQVVGPSLVPLLPAGSSVTPSLSVRKLVKSSGSGGGGISSSSSSPSHHFNSSHQSSYNSVYNHQHHQHHRHFHHHPSHHGNQHMVPGNLPHHRHSFNPQLKTTSSKSGISIEKNTASGLLPTSTSSTQSGLPNLYSYPFSS